MSRPGLGQPLRPSDSQQPSDPGTQTLARVMGHQGREAQRAASAMIVALLIAATTATATKVTGGKSNKLQVSIRFEDKI